jgi:hypothetical protein
MRQPRKTLKEVIRAAVVCAAAAWIPSAWAQATLIIPPMPPVVGMGIPAPVFDTPTETNTYDTALSLVTSTTPANDAPNTSIISTLDQALFNGNGVNSANAATLMPVTQGLPCDSYDPMVTQIAPALAQTYEAAISNTQQLMTELTNEDFAADAANLQAPYQLGSNQANGQILLDILKELQLTRAQLAALTMTTATDKLHQLDTDVRPTMPRQGGGC